MVAVPFLEKGISMTTSNRRSFSEEIQRAISEPHQAKQPNCESVSNLNIMAVVEAVANKNWQRSIEDGPHRIVEKMKSHCHTFFVP
jgi:hypothetical protein